MVRDGAYLKAEQKINEALQFGAKKLDLSWKWNEEGRGKLTSLPESLRQLTKLQTLNLSNNQLTVLPEWLGNLTQLQELNLSGNQLEELPEWLGNLTQLKTLDLRDNHLTEFPEWLEDLTQLQRLNLSDNQLAELPEWLGNLTQLQELNLSGNQLEELPEWLGNLTQLQDLHLSGNQLAELPESLGQLTHLSITFWGMTDATLELLAPSLGKLEKLLRLEISNGAISLLPETIAQISSLTELSIHANELVSIPESFGNLRQIRSLSIGGNKLTEFPEFIRNLQQLEVLYLWNNNIKAIPDWIVELSNLKFLDLDRNPLRPDLAAAYKDGFAGVKRYLLEIAKGARERYEAKLLILGDGNEGKTCVSRALRGLPFREQKTTRGVEVVQWKFAHPDQSADPEKEITLNIWDFEGQEISHQTHQFFLTSQSLYLLVFKCRDQFLLDRAEYWLDTIRARAPEAKVAIVITQCEGRMPMVPLDRIQAQYSDLLAKEWFFSVGCQDESNVQMLRTYLQRWAADIEFMGSLWPVSYEKAEAELKDKAKRGTARISRDKLYVAFRKAGVSKDSYEDAAAALERLGVLTQFPGCPDLRNFVVLRPQWLTKAISKVMEDKQLSQDQGEIALQRMEAMWQEGYRGMFTTFHDCMKEFELCYDLEDGARSCLVPLRFGYLRPTIPWSADVGMKMRRVEYKLNIRPPMGIMSRFIVKTHHMIVKTESQPKGVYWHNGVFLRSGESPLCSEALCEFVPEDRKLCLEVRAAYPQNMCEQIHAYVKAVFSFFSGLEAERSYGCIKVDLDSGAEDRCSGVHTEKRIYTAISRLRNTIDCEFEDHEVDPRLLVGGFGSFSEFVKAKMVSVAQLRQELDKQPDWAAQFLRGVDALQDWVQANCAKMDQLIQAQATMPAEFRQELDLKLYEYLALTDQMLDDRAFTAAPGLISINTKDRSKWDPAGYFNKTYVLTPYCECKGNIHACTDGCVEFTRDRVWWQKTAPWVARATKLLSAGITLAFAGMPLALGKEGFEVIKDHVTFMSELTKHMNLEDGGQKQSKGEEVAETGIGKGIGEADKESRLTQAALAGLLEELAPINYRARQWGSMRRVRMPDNSHRWLCAGCAKLTR